jgi:D-aminoacyl-tRNA deacylase
VEVGSGPDQWADPDAARAVARAILDLRGVAPDRQPEGATGDERADGDAGPAADADRRHLVGVGGGHYAPRFERVLRETDWAVGHVAADWGLEAVDGSGDLPGVLGEALAESRAAYALVEGDRPGVREAVEAAGGRVVSETWVRETDGLPLPFVRTVESAVAGVEAGLRFGEPAAGYGGGFVVVDLPGEILDEARGIDREATLALFRERTLAFVTDQDGSRPTGPAVLRAAGAYRSLVDGLLDVLRERYDTVEREGGAGGDGAVLVRETAFDPEKARTLGVPEGPAFGRLADGQPVEVDGNSIPPEAVREERERRLPLDGGVIRASDTDESY